MLQRSGSYRHSKHHVRRAASAGIAIVLAIGLSLGGMTRALADDAEEESFETKLLKSLFGLDTPNITYRERSPLVVPPTRDLPPPETPALTADPSWPKDPEAQPKKKTRAAAARRKDWDEEARPLSPAELDRGRRAGAGLTPATTARNDAGAPLRPDELGYRGGLFGSLFKGGSDKDEVGVFRGEPPRTSLTAPPAGYLTPSPNHPYGLSAKKEAPKPLSRDDQVTRNQ